MNENQLPFQIAPDLLKRLKDDNDVVALFLYGSRVEGLSFNTSDLDICAITRNSTSQSYETYRETYFDIEKISEDKLRSIVKKVNAGEFDEMPLVWCHRLKTALTLYDPKEVIRDVQDELDAERICLRLVDFYSLKAGSLLYDSLGAFKGDDFETALVTARLAVDNAALAFLSTMGVIDPRVRWFYKRLRRATGPGKENILSSYRRLQHLAVGEDDKLQLEKYIDVASDFVSTVTMKAQTANLVD